ncbi:adenylyl-sulfate kinase 3-like isoform X2 [Apium graveolens]|uniref:adenylyl-sulfate kinase 3-like isoform X2 n=1 Tax=Apium graveolens TaxID=4045 RepID=UPI003D78D313
MIANTCNYYHYCFLNSCSIDASGSSLSASKLGFSSFNSFTCGLKCSARSDFLKVVKAMDSSRTSHIESNNIDVSGGNYEKKCVNGMAENVVWHNCSVQKIDRQELLQQKGCVIWITGLSGSGKSTLACALARGLHMRGKLTYILDGDNVRHGLNKDLTFKADDRVENIRRIGEVAKLFADAGVISIASLISPYRKDRDACRALLQEGDFVEVYMDIPLQVCEARDPKGLYKLARAGKIKDDLEVTK